MNRQVEARLRSLETKLDQVLTALRVPLCEAVVSPHSENDSPQEINDQLVNLDEAARGLGISAGHLRNLQWAEKVPHYRIGTSVRFHVAELREHFSRKVRRRTP